MSDQVSFTPQRALSSTIAASAGAKARFYQTGTVTPITVYADAAGTVPLAQPVVADAAGVFAQVFSTATTAVKAVVTAADDTALFTLDPCALTPTESGLASQVSVVPFTGVAATNVQAALEEIQVNIGDQTTNSQTIVQTGGSGDAYTLTPAAPITDYAQGQRFLIRPNHANSGAATMDVDALGPKALMRYEGALIANLRPNDLRIGDVSEIVYDGTRFVLITAPRDGVPIGTPLFWNATTLPIGYVWEDGATYSQTTYPEAFAVLGTTFNVGGEPAGTFRVPDSRGEFIRAWDNGRGVDTGRVFGSAQADDLKSHQHIGGFAGQNANAAYGTADTGITANLNDQSGTSVGNYPRTSLTGGTETRPRNVAKGVIVRLF